MNQKEIETVILLFKHDTVTYSDICGALPDLQQNDLRISSISGIGAPHKYFYLVRHISDPQECLQYQFLDTDIFKLSENGQNLLYRLRKEKRQSLLSYISIVLSAIAAITGILALFH